MKTPNKFDIEQELDKLLHLKYGKGTSLVKSLRKFNETVKTTVKDLHKNKTE